MRASRDTTQIFRTIRVEYKHVASMYKGRPATKLKGIENRDKPKS